MKALVETNLFYYWSKLEYSDYKPDIIDSNLKQFDEIFLSELTLLELIVHYRKDKNKIFDAFNFIADKHIAILPYLSKDKTLLLKDLNQLMHYDWFFDYFVQDTFENKIDIETSFFVFWLSSIVGIFSVILFTKTPFNSQSKSNNFIRQYYALIMSMQDKKGYLYEQIHIYLEDFYLSEDSVKLKDNIVDLILINLYVLMTNFKSAQYEKLFTQLANGPDQLPEDELKQILSDLNTDFFTKKIWKRMDYENKLVDIKKEKFEFDTAISGYEKEMNKIINPAITKYYILLFNKFFNIKDKKLEKNDIIDSLFLKYYPDFQILTCDKGFRSVIKEIDDSYYHTNEEFIKKCK